MRIIDTLAISETVRASIAPTALVQERTLCAKALAKASTKSSRALGALLHAIRNSMRPYPCKPQHGFTHLYNRRGKRMVGEAGGPETGLAPLPKTQRP
ncbi:MAG: hypothetical protein KGJ32_12165 [Xanthomonadaceae bacterium]|nr:hypothetical protein [Xanthomonadaceae bacterium]